MDTEAKVLEIIRELQESSHCIGLPIREITGSFIDRHGEDFERKITPHWIGQIVRRKLGLKTEKQHGSYVIATTERDKLARLFEKFGIETHPENLGDSGNLGTLFRGPLADSS